MGLESEGNCDDSKWGKRKGGLLKCVEGPQSSPGDSWEPLSDARSSTLCFRAVYCSFHTGLSVTANSLV